MWIKGEGWERGKKGRALKASSVRIALTAANAPFWVERAAVGVGVDGVDSDRFS